MARKKDQKKRLQEGEVNPDVQKRLRSFFRQMNFRFLAFFFTLFLFFATAVLYVSAKRNAEKQEAENGEVVEENGTEEKSLDLAKWAMFLAPASSAALVILASIMYTRRIKEAQEFDLLHKKLDGYQRASILRMILLDGAGMINLAIYMMVGHWIFLCFAAVIGALFVAFKPNATKFIADLKLDEIEEKVIRTHLERRPAMTESEDKKA